MQDPPSRAPSSSTRAGGRLVARGAAENPAGRFERLRLEEGPDDDGGIDGADDDAPPVPTVYLRDPSRSVLAHNQSPDVGFDTSVNPYRGCEHGCVYCLDPATPVLFADLAWRPLGEVAVGDELVGFDELPAPGRTRKLRRARVENVWWSRKPALRLVTRREEVVTTAEHRWLEFGSHRWLRTEELEAAVEIRHLSLEPARDAGHQAACSIDPEPVEAIEPIGRRDVVDIQTSTGTFYAAGMATHNCYARPSHEYLGFSAGLDFETRILVKPDAPRLLRRALSAPGWRPQVVAMSGVTDPYQPVERRLRITRGCLEVLAEFRNPVAIVTKSALVARDADLLAELAAVDAAAVNVSITTLDDELRRRMEPRAASPRARLEAIERLARAGVPTGVMVAPVIPGLNDAEIPAIVQAAANAGARSAAWILLRLPHGVAELFEAWLERHVPERRKKVMNRMRSLRGGRLNDPRFHARMRGGGAFAAQVESLFALACRRARLDGEPRALSTAAFRRPGGEQLGLL